MKYSLQNKPSASAFSKLTSMLCATFLITTPLFADSHALTEEELNALLSGKTVRGIYLDNNSPFTRYYDEDGEVRQRVEKETEEGTWFIDTQGRRCIVWSGKEKKCRVIMKDKELYKEFTIMNNNKPKAVVIYNKITEGNPNGL